MALPIEHEALEQIGPPQERAVGGVGAAEHDVIAAAGAGVAAVDHELVGAEARVMRVLVKAVGGLDRLAPGRGRVDVDFDDAGVGRHLDDVDARIVRRRIALDLDRQAKLGGGRFDRREQFEIILEPLDRRHEHAEPAVAQLDRQRRAHRHATLACDVGHVRGAVGRASGCALVAVARRWSACGRWRVRRATARARRTDRPAPEADSPSGVDVGQRLSAAGAGRAANRPAPGTAGRAACCQISLSQPGFGLRRPALHRQHDSRPAA